MGFMNKFLEIILRNLFINTHLSYYDIDKCVFMNKFLKIILSLVVHGWLNYRTRLVFTTCFIHRLFKGRYRITEVDFVVRRPKDYQAQQWKACVRILYLFARICKELYKLYKRSGNYCFLVHTISIMEIIVSYTQIRN